MSSGTQFISSSPRFRDRTGRLPPRAKGTSLFRRPSCPARSARRSRNDVIVVAGLDHKIRDTAGLPNLSWNFGEGAKARLVGYRCKSGEGCWIMFQMMNEARINLELGAAALAWRLYPSRAYAAERRQGRRLGSE